MPNRGIKESICWSESLAVLSAEAERLFYRLLVQCDDYGLMIGNPRVIANRCFQANADAVKEKQIVGWLSELEEAGLIRFYEVDGSRYLKYVKWEKHNSVRAKNPKFPLPEQGSGVMVSDASTCKQMQTDACNSPRDTRHETRDTRHETRTRDGGKLTLAPLVRLTPEEHQTLIEKHGADATTWMIQRLQDYKEANGKAYKSDAAAIRSWVASAWEDEKRRRGKDHAEPLPAWLEKGAPIPDDKG
jgi:hypothetical protein